MQLFGVIKNKTQMENGKSTNGNEWKRITILVETIGDHPKEVAIVFLNRMAEIAQKERVGNVVKIQLDAESRLYEGRYYTELRGYSILPAYQSAPTEAAAPAAPIAAAPEAPDFNEGLDDLPY